MCLFPEVFAVANPANISAFILSIPEKSITLLTRLDHNRALGGVREIERTGI